MYDFQITQNKAVQELPTLYYYPLYNNKEELQFYGRIKLKSFRSYQFTLRLKVPKQYYNPETKLFTVQAYNDYINKIKQVIKNIYLKKYADEIVSDELLNSIYRDTVAFLTQKKVNSKKVNLRFNIDTLLIDYCKFISINKAKGTINNYHNSCKLINTYCKKHNIRTTNEIPDKVLDDFIICLEQEFNYKHNTIHKQLVFLKSFLKYCYENNKTSKHFGANHKSKYNTLQLPDNIKHLSKEDIIKLEKLDNLSKNEEAAKDLFLFQYHTGLSYTDTQNFDFEKDTVQKDNCIFFSKVRNKNSNRVNKVYQKNILSKEAITILEKYGNKAPKMGCSLYDAYLKKIAKKAGLNQHISSHVARKTKGYLMLNEGVPIEVVQTILGHSDIKTTQSYYARVDFDLIQKFVK